MPPGPGQALGESISSADETTALLNIQEQQQQRYSDRIISYPDSKTALGTTGAGNTSPYAYLPLALLAALAVAAIAATTVFAYASLLCEDPTDCGESERSAYAGTVAAASCVANVCGLLFLGTLEKLSKRNRRAGLILWLVLRSMSVFVLAFGVQIRSIVIALSGRLFEGLASDNLLHFNLNAIYVQTLDSSEVPRLIGASLGLYMIGISVSPFVAGLFENFRLSFLIALALFAIALLYLLVFVGGTKPNQSSNPHVDDDEMTQAEGTAGTSSPTIIPWRNCFASSLSPLGAFQKRPIAMLSGLSLLIYNVGQSYIFSAIMVYTSTRFGFSAKQNGILVSIAHAASATYLFSALFAVPRILQFLRRSRPIVHSPLPLVDIPQTADTIFALLSLIMQSISLVSLALATKDWQVYPIITVFAVGLAAPSFIKSHCVALFSADDAPQVVAALAIAETTGGLLAPVLLGGWQAMWPESGVFLVAATTMGISAVFFFVGALVGRINRRRTRL